MYFIKNFAINLIEAKNVIEPFVEINLFLLDFFIIHRFEGEIFIGFIDCSLTQCSSSPNRIRCNVVSAREKLHVIRIDSWQSNKVARSE